MIPDKRYIDSSRFKCITIRKVYEKRREGLRNVRPEMSHLCHQIMGRHRLFSFNLFFGIATKIKKLPSCKCDVSSPPYRVAQ